MTHDEPIGPYFDRIRRAEALRSESFVNASLAADYVLEGRLDLAREYALKHQAVERRLDAFYAYCQAHDSDDSGRWIGFEAHKARR